MGDSRVFSSLFLIVLGLTVLIWFLRGIRVLAFLPGGVLWVAILLSAALGIVASWQSSRRW